MDILLEWLRTVEMLALRHYPTTLVIDNDLPHAGAMVEIEPAIMTR
jgi:hypothetical protein